MYIAYKQLIPNSLTVSMKEICSLVKNNEIWLEEILEEITALTKKDKENYQNKLGDEVFYHRKMLILSALGFSYK